MNPLRPVLAFWLLALFGAAATPAALAQQVFRIVGPDGRVTFSDKPPPATNARPAPAVPLPGVASSEGLPFELRQVVGRYPVTLYTGNDCAPCSAGKNFLASRGIPFVEKTVTTNDDVEALTRLIGSPSLPLLTIGGQQLKGYSEAEWAQFLDAAGYPRTSALPPSYRPVPPTPLVAIQQPAAAPVAPAAPVRPPPSAAASPAPAAPSGSNPAGIRF